MGGVERGAGGPKTANSANLNSRQRPVSQGAALSEHQQRQQQQMGDKDDKEVPLGGVKHVPWALFPQTMHVVASRRFSEHILIKVGRGGRGKRLVKQASRWAHASFLELEAKTLSVERLSTEDLRIEKLENQSFQIAKMPSCS